MPDDAIHVLVVDDLPDKRLALTAALEPLGVSIIAADSGAEALRHLLTRDFAAILLDVNMPDMDGFETAGLIRKRPRSEHTPIIFITGYGDEVHAIQGYSLGAVDYILSPVVPEVLRTKVGVFVELYRKTQQVKKQAEQQVALAREQAARAAAEQATRHFRFLAEATTALARTLDVEATLRGLLRLTVPALADLAGVTLLGDAGPPWRSELAWAVGPGKAVHLGSLTSPEGPTDELRGALERVLATGEQAVLDGLDVPYPPPAVAGETADTGRVRTALILPLLARGRTLGALTLAQGASGRRFGPGETALAEDLAGRAAVALDNARLYRDIQDADRRKDEFLAMLAHELRNPLAPIRNAVGILRQPAADPAAVTWSREVIDRQVQQVVRLVDDLLDVSRITRGKITIQPTLVDAAALVAGAVETSGPLIAARKHRLTTDLPPEPLWVNADPTRLAQVLANLLNNAAKYTPEGGAVSLTAVREDGEVVFRVKDTGVGIPHGMLGSVFEPFTQLDRTLDRAQGGLGIGLTLVKRLVELHGGRVEAHSAGPGHGSEFVVRLPAAVPPGDRHPVAAHAPGTNGEAARGNRPLRVYVVDDNQDAATSLAVLLQTGGYDVHVFFDGAAVLAAWDEATADVTLLDIGLPGMDGYAVARALRCRPGGDRLLLVAVTGYGQESDQRRALDAGFDQHLVKPVDPEQVLRLLAGRAPVGA
jgi:signal transduction histidine kinase/DNA-binding response OmpR family regulator